MRPVIIGIGGGGSGVGKTTVACRILEKFPSWGAIKYTKIPLYGSVTDDLKVLSQKGKDTKRFLDAGAERVLWVQSPFHELAEVLPTAIEMLSDLQGVIVEGNSAVEVLRPDIVIFVAGPEGKIKEGAESVLRMADIIVSDKGLPGVHQRAKKFRMDEIGTMMEFVSATVRDKK
jgi:molybdopterin-guanine dinucleotide biosynthesis protein